MIQANCRARFTAQDFEFVIRVLGRDSRQKISLVDLLTDPESRDQILDDESLYRAILENTGNLTISPQFYFYVLARLVLRRVGIEDRTLSDYVAALLEIFRDQSGCLGVVLYTKNMFGWRNHCCDLYDGGVAGQA